MRTLAIVGVGQVVSEVEEGELTLSIIRTSAKFCRSQKFVSKDPCCLRNAGGLSHSISFYDFADELMQNMTYLRPRFNPGGIQRYTGKALFRVFIASSEEPKSASHRLQCSSWKGHSQRKAF
ncbi:hypothetical protein AAWM_00820 [Aspergillus awamori]|uniref:Uncharacterized protein n=1 Tax=Aspergillus awamori TaxID=105351 RepID=A0A401KFI4_ASPAW|nr:hypothetical protein AAWM_00820 [Aspergillus awamori]